jgi:DNA-dependent protein kinase catalytic subunit
LVIIILGLGGLLPSIVIQILKFLFREELSLGHSKKPAFHAMVSVLQGDKRENMRAQLPPTGLTAEQQVAALIDQATDPNILGRVYAGWEPWM